MADNPLISVALCTYNGSLYLKEQLDSVLSQTYPNIEIIAIDDCSSDDTVDLLRSYAAKDQRVQVFENNENLGYNRNFEKALSICSGELIAICDQDDIWQKDKLEKQAARISGHTLVYHDSDFIDKSGKPIGKKISDKFNFYRGSDPRPFIYLNCVSGHSILLRKSLLGNALPFPAGFHYDQWLAFVATSVGSINFIDESLVKYRQHEKNSTDILAQKTVQKKRSQKLSEQEKEAEWLRICANRSPAASGTHLLKLARLCEDRNRSFFSIAYGFEIWKGQTSYLALLKKKKMSRFFYVLRKIWGRRTKQFFG